MKVSIIVPVYNVSNYIVTCLDSIVAQTYHNIECILVNDCGQDDSIEKASNYINHYSGLISFKIIHHPNNKGLSGARNTGINVANGDYLYFLDSDDAITPNCIETLVLLAEKYPTADFIQGNNIFNDNKPSPHSFSNIIPEYCENKEELEKIMLQKVITSAWNRLIKRSFIIQHKLFFPEGIVHEDMYWVFFLAKYSNAASFTTKATYLYNAREGSIMTSTTKGMYIKRLKSRLYASNAYYHDIINNRPTSSSPRRMYLCVNLFSCLTELYGLSSLKYWFIFWSQIIKIAFYNIHHVSWYRFLFLLVLLPPACFFSRKDNLSWRIQQRIISHL